MNRDSTYLRGAPQVSSTTLTHQAGEVVERAGDPVTLGISLVVDDTRPVTLPPELAQFVFSIITATSRDGFVSVRTMPTDLTTSVAASELGISRPTLMTLIRRGDLPAHKVGTHTRVKRSDVVEFREARNARRVEALHALLEADESTDEG